MTIKTTLCKNKINDTHDNHQRRPIYRLLNESRQPPVHKTPKHRDNMNMKIDGKHIGDSHKLEIKMY